MVLIKSSDYAALYRLINIFSYANLLVTTLGRLVLLFPFCAQEMRNSKKLHDQPKVTKLPDGKLGHKPWSSYFKFHVIAQTFGLLAWKRLV